MFGAQLFDWGMNNNQVIGRGPMIFDQTNGRPDNSFDPVAFDGFSRNLFTDNNGELAEFSGGRIDF